MRGMIHSGWMFFTVVAAAALGCAGVQVSSGPSTMVYPRLSLDSVRNAIYPCEQCAGGRVTLDSGIYTEPVTSGSTDLLTVTLLDRFTTFGELDSDGNNDAAVILTVQGKGNSVFYNLVAVVNTGSGPEARAAQTLGDRIRVNSVTITAGEILVDLYRQAPGAAVSNPTQKYRESYRLDGSMLTLVDQVEVPR